MVTECSFLGELTLQKKGTFWIMEFVL